MCVVSPGHFARNEHCGKLKGGWYAQYIVKKCFLALLPPGVLLQLAPAPRICLRHRSVALHALHSPQRAQEPTAPGSGVRGPAGVIDNVLDQVKVLVARVRIRLMALKGPKLLQRATMGSEAR